MIVINNIEELNKYITKTQLINYNSIRNLTTYEFKEDGKLADVVFNVKIDFSAKFDIPDGVDLFDIPNLEEDTKFDLVQFTAKSIDAKETLKVGILQADNLSFENTCAVSYLIDINESIKGDKLDCEFLTIKCEKIDCKHIIAKKIICKKLKAKELCLPTAYFENIKADNVNFYNQH